MSHGSQKFPLQSIPLSFVNLINMFSTRSRPGPRKLKRRPLCPRLPNFGASPPISTDMRMNGSRSLLYLVSATGQFVTFYYCEHTPKQWDLADFPPRNGPGLALLRTGTLRESGRDIG